MNRILETLRRFFLEAYRVLALAWDLSLKWLSIPLNLCFAVLCLVFAVSFVSWAVGDHFEEALLFFPDSKGVLHGEVREVSHSRGAEARAELIASEVLLGPKTTDLLPAFVSNVRVESVLLRKNMLFVDISPGAALASPEAINPNTIKWGIAAMERSLRTSLPGIKRLTITIGGKEPYTVGLKAEGGPSQKKPENN
jgi:hypothetical protein